LYAGVGQVEQGTIVGGLGLWRLARIRRHSYLRPGAGPAPTPASLLKWFKRPSPTIFAPAVRQIVP
ncbi:hypothetical protein NL389_38640, partial [Klebsiella pneumoniae]|nr:hypothetical protein [Klebsiella pneumoniae]